jgi:hypothetical protein
VIAQSRLRGLHCVTSLSERVRSSLLRRVAADGEQASGIRLLLVERFADRERLDRAYACVANGTRIGVTREHRRPAVVTSATAPQDGTWSVGSILAFGSLCALNR